VRPMGLPAGGVMGIKLDDEADGIVAVELVAPGSLVWSVTDDGLAKATPINQYPTQGRYGQGVINMRLPKGSEEVAAAVVGMPKSTIYLIMASGSVRRTTVDKAYHGSRNVKPRSVVSVTSRNRVTGAVRLSARPASALPGD
jgi:DNA gyrase subunit A